MENNRLGVALVKYVCPICGQIDEDASAIVINRKLTKKFKQQVESMHNQVVGFSNKPCKECQSYIDQGAFFVIGIDPEQTDDMKNPYRTGHLVGIRKLSEFYQHLADEYKHRDAVFMDYREMEKLGMIQEQ